MYLYSPLSDPISISPVVLPPINLYRHGMDDFVCDSVSEFGAMGSTSFFGFPYPNLLLVFLNLLCFRNLFICFIFLPVLVFLCSIFCL